MKTITLTIPTVNPADTLSNLGKNFTNKIASVRSSVFAFTDYAQTDPAQPVSQTPKINVSQKAKDLFNGNKKNLKFLPFIGLALVLMVAVGLFLRGSDRGVLGQSDSEKISLEEATSEQEINQTFSFPVLDSSGKKAGELKYTVENAELRDQLIIKGQQARAVEGRTFLIISLKLKNDTKSAISVNTRDFIRLKRKGSDELLAPTIHNDPVEAQAISTLTTRVGFSVNADEVEGMSLQIGEITGDKKTVDLNLQ